MKGAAKPTKARGSQSTMTESRGGQNRPDPGGKAGAGLALGKAQRDLTPVGSSKRAFGRTNR